MSATATSPGKPLRADAQRNRVRVLEAANRCFCEKGLDAQMDDIAARAGVGVGTVYRHFPTKDALVQALAAERFARLAERAKAALEEPDPVKAFESFMRDAAEIQSADRGLSQIQAHDPLVMRQAAERQSDLMESTEKLVERAKAAGGLRQDVSAGDVPMVMCALSGIMRAESLGGRYADWRRFLELQLEGMRA